VASIAYRLPVFMSCLLEQGVALLTLILALSHVTSQLFRPRIRDPRLTIARVDPSHRPACILEGEEHTRRAGIVGTMNDDRTRRCHRPPSDPQPAGGAAVDVLPVHVAEGQIVVQRHLAPRFTDIADPANRSFLGHSRKEDRLRARRISAMHTRWPRSARGCLRGMAAMPVMSCMLRSMALPMLPPLIFSIPPPQSWPSASVVAADVTSRRPILPSPRRIRPLPAQFGLPPVPFQMWRERPTAAQRAGDAIPKRAPCSAGRARVGAQEIGRNGPADFGQEADSSRQTPPPTPPPGAWRGRARRGFAAGISRASGPRPSA